MMSDIRTWDHFEQATGPRARDSVACKLFAWVLALAITRGWVAASLGNEANELFLCLLAACHIYCHHTME